MFVPVHDNNPLKSIHFQYVTVGLIAMNLAVFITFQTGWFFHIDERLAAFTFIPKEFWTDGAPFTSHASVPEGALPVQESWTLVTYMFVHGNMMHLVGNMLFLWVFGDNVEDAMGHFRFLMFFLMCGVFAGQIHHISVHEHVGHQRPALLYRQRAFRHRGMAGERRAVSPELFRDKREGRQAFVDREEPACLERYEYSKIQRDQCDRHILKMDRLERVLVVQGNKHGGITLHWRSCQTVARRAGA